MSTETKLVSLTDLDFVPYLNENGEINPELSGLIGVYAIFNKDRELLFVGYSRDVYSSLKQHLIRHPQSCYWFKLKTIDRPSRKVLEEIRQTWLKENNTNPEIDLRESASWTQPIDIKPMMSDEEKEKYAQCTELEQIKLLKKISRRIQANIEAQLESRQCKMSMRFNPKLKEQGLLDLKS